MYVIWFFEALQISVKLGSKLGQKLTTFLTLWARAPTELQFSIFSYHGYVANKETNKTMPAIFLFLNVFLTISFSLFSWKIHFQNSSNYCYKKWTTHYYKKRGHGFVQQSVRSVCSKFKVDRFNRFRTGARQVFTTQKPFPSEIPLTMKTATLNSL